METIKRLIAFFRRSIRNKLLIALPVVLGFVLLVSFTLNFLFFRQQLGEASTASLLTTQLIGFIITFTVVIVAISVTVLAIAHLLSDPLRRLVAETDLVTQTDTLQLSHQISTRTDEVGDLAQHINGLLVKQAQKLATVTAQASLGKLARQIAHDIQSPLTSIGTGVRFLNEQAEDLSPSVVECIRLLEMGEQRLKSISQYLLERRHETETAVTFKWFSMDSLCNALVQEFRAQPLGEGVNFVTEYHTTPLKLRGDQVGWQRVLGNLMKNALEAMQQYSDAECRQLSLRSYEKDEKLIFEVADTGPGIPRDLIPKVIGGNFTHNKKGGHGIGMQVVREIVEAHNGSLDCNSISGSGTTFRLSLPLMMTSTANAPLYSS